MQAQNESILYVLDPDEAVRDSVRLLLDSFDIEVRVYADGDSFMKEVAPAAPGCALVENQLPGLTGLALLSRLREMGNTMPVLLMTSSRDGRLERHAMELGAAFVIRKPMVSEQLLEHLAVLMQPAPPGNAGK